MSDAFEIAIQKENMMDEILATTWYAFEKDGGMYQIIGKCYSEEEAMRTARNPLANPDDIAFVISAQEFLDLADGVRTCADNLYARTWADQKLQTEILGY